MQPQNPQNQQLDPTIVNMARAIKSVETTGQSDPYKARGKSGEFGAYQFTEPMWKDNSRKFLGQEVPLEQSTIEQQNRVAYGRIKELKDQGFTPAQVASIWNSGRADPTGNVGVNKHGVQYDVPKYVNSVVGSYEQFKGGKAPTPVSTQSTVESAEGELTLGQELKGRNEQIQKGIDLLKKGTVGGGFSGALQVGAAALGGAGDITSRALESIPGVGSVVKKVESAVGDKLSSLAQTSGGQQVIASWQDFAQAHPEAAEDISAIGTIVSSIPVFKGLGMVKELGTGLLSKSVAKRELSNIISDVAPKETAGRLAEGIAKRGTTKSFLSGRISVPHAPSVEKLATIVRDNVPGFSKVKSLAERIDLTRDTADLMANDLKKQIIAQGADRIYPIKELASRIAKAEEPISLKGTPFEKQIAPLKKAALQIAKEKGGTISNLFDARKEFDALVRKTFPNLYDKEYSPMRQAVKAVRDSMNDYISENLPSGIGYGESLNIQSNLLKAIDNMAEKAASGQMREIGTTRLQRFGMRHPMLRNVYREGKRTALGALGGTAIGAAGVQAYNALKND